MKRKSPTPLTVVSGRDVLPDQIAPDLPEVVTQRFPELSDWADKLAENWDSAKGSIQRFQDDIASAVNKNIKDQPVATAAAAATVTKNVTEIIRTTVQNALL